MPAAPSTMEAGPGARLRALGLVLPKPPTPLGAYVESARVGSLLFLSGTLPISDGKMAFTGRLGESLTIEQGREAARMAALNSLALAQEHLGDLNRVKRLVKLAVLMVTTDEFELHAAVGDGASNLFAQLFGPENGHVRAVYGVLSLPKKAPVMVDAVFEIE